MIDLGKRFMINEGLEEVEDEKAEEEFEQRALDLYYREVTKMRLEQGNFFGIGTGYIKLPNN